MVVSPTVSPPAQTTSVYSELSHHISKPFNLTKKNLPIYTVSFHQYSVRLEPDSSSQVISLILASFYFLWSLQLAIVYVSRS